MHRTYQVWTLGNISFAVASSSTHIAPRAPIDAVARGGLEPGRIVSSCIGCPFGASVDRSVSAESKRGFCCVVALFISPPITTKWRTTSYPGFFRRVFERQQPPVRRAMLTCNRNCLRNARRSDRHSSCGRLIRVPIVVGVPSRLAHT